MGSLGTYTAATPKLRRHPAPFEKRTTGTGASTSALVEDVLKNTVIDFIRFFGLGFPEAAWRNLSVLSLMCILRALTIRARVFDVRL